MISQNSKLALLFETEMWTLRAKDKKSHSK
jgi:hypothetical protein